MLEFFNHLVPADFMPHGYCYLWDPWLVWLNVASDGMITLSYYCIPFVLIYFIHKRRDLPFNWIFWMFGGFILACGTTHLMEVWNVWHASYALAGVIKAITAVISVTTLVRARPASAAGGCDSESDWPTGAESQPGSADRCAPASRRCRSRCPVSAPHESGYRPGCVVRRFDGFSLLVERAVGGV